jgi:serine/threonine-protein kinase RsbW
MDYGMKRARCIGKIVLSIPSDDRCLRLLDLVAHHIAGKTEFSEEDAEHIRLAVIEAGTNAMRHGNMNDPEKTVTLRILDQADRLIISVKDCGSGFDLSCVEDPLRPENLMKSCGRGIFLMRALMDEVEYDMDSSSGTEVRLVKYKASLNLRPEKLMAGSAPSSLPSEEATQLVSVAGLS